MAIEDNSVSYVVQKMSSNIFLLAFFSDLYNSKYIQYVILKLSLVFAELDTMNYLQYFPKRRRTREKSPAIRTVLKLCFSKWGSLLDNSGRQRVQGSIG